jgi:hypothetical protein
MRRKNIVWRGNCAAYDSRAGESKHGITQLTILQNAL